MGGPHSGRPRIVLKPDRLQRREPTAGAPPASARALAKLRLAHWLPGDGFTGIAGLFVPSLA